MAGAHLANGALIPLNADGSIRNFVGANLPNFVAPALASTTAGQQLASNHASPAPPVQANLQQQPDLLLQQQQADAAVASALDALARTPSTAGKRCFGGR